MLLCRNCHKEKKKEGCPGHHSSYHETCESCGKFRECFDCGHGASRRVAAVKRFCGKELRIQRISLPALVEKAKKEFPGVPKDEVFVECSTGAPLPGDCFFVTVGKH